MKLKTKSQQDRESQDHNLIEDNKMKLTVDINNLDTRRAEKLSIKIGQLVNVSPRIKRIHICEKDYRLMKRSVNYRVKKRLSVDRASRLVFCGFKFGDIALVPVDA